MQVECAVQRGLIPHNDVLARSFLTLPVLLGRWIEL